MATAQGEFVSIVVIFEKWCVLEIDAISPGTYLDRVELPTALIVLLCHRLAVTADQGTSHTLDLNKVLEL